MAIGGFSMKQNMGLIDRIIRVGFAAVVAVLYFTHQLSPAAAVILGVLSVVFIATSAVGFCPLYLPLKISTKKRTA